MAVTTTTNVYIRWWLFSRPLSPPDRRSPCLAASSPFFVARNLPPRPLWRRRGHDPESGWKEVDVNKVIGWQRRRRHSNVRLQSAWRLTFWNQNFFLPIGQSSGFNEGGGDGQRRPFLGSASSRRSCRAVRRCCCRCSPADPSTSSSSCTSSRTAALLHRRAILRFTTARRARRNRTRFRSGQERKKRKQKVPLVAYSANFL